MAPNREKRVQAYVNLIRSADTLHLTVGRGLMVDGLTQSQFSTLKTLRMHGPLSQRDIGKHILKTGGNITVVVDNLEREGLVARDRDTKDRRLIYVRLTPAGERLFDQVYPGHLDRIREAMAPLSDDECRQLVGLLEKLSPAEGVECCAPASLAETAIV